MTTGEIAGAAAGQTSAEIRGGTAAEIVDSVRDLVERGGLRPGVQLPSVRTLADRLGVNRNTVVAAYRQLGQAGLVVTRGRAGTQVAGRSAVAQEGYAADTVLRDVATGNPDPAHVPDPGPALAALSSRPVMYGEPVVDAGLEDLARGWLDPDVGAAGERRLTVTSGAFDAVERLLAQALTRDDAVALEDPCFLATIRTVRLAGYRPVPVPVDAEGMTVDGLRAALESGVRAVVCTPRAQNPTGASLSESRAAALRELLAEHPYVLVVEDDHYSLLSRRPFRTIVGPDHRRWALIRSVSKFLGPDMSLALTATDPETADRLAMRLSPGTTWVSHILQRLAHALLTDDAARRTIERAAVHYADRNAAFTARLAAHGIDVPGSDGLSLWVPLPGPARDVSEHLMRRGWLARTGDEFAIDDADPSWHLRLTVHHLDDDAAQALADDVAAACGAVAGR
ncbi:aminotransferase class I/II-fold pyridoxal phosphate-dependent enzyme [Georgenia sp. Z1491]|uniref:aminotransferase class I/II-fold pyridoxal phosphate-dependent enzyme n=1 Tax=Georgenia sp. Z1491 TaxID=3416707 RepID=UPI003CF1E131